MYGNFLEGTSGGPVSLGEFMNVGLTAACAVGNAQSITDHAVEFAEAIRWLTAKELLLEWTDIDISHMVGVQ